MEPFITLLTAGDVHAAVQALPFDYSEAYTINAGNQAYIAMIGRIGCTVVTTRVRECDWSEEFGPECPGGGVGTTHTECEVRSFRTPDLAMDYIRATVDNLGSEIAWLAGMASAAGIPAPTMAPL